MTGVNPFAPVLDEVAGRIAGTEPCWRTDPARWAYCLREAVGVVRPDWLITHHDCAAEADAVTAAVTDAAAVVDVELADTGILAAALELTSVLTELYPRQSVVASVTGPGMLSLAVAQRLSTPSKQLPDLVADIGDLLGALVGGYVAAGAARVVVWESAAGESLDDLVDDVADAHGPMMRRLDTMGVPAVLCGGDGLTGLGYATHVVAGQGLVPAARFGAEPFPTLWQDLTRNYGGPIVTDGPIPGDCDLSLLAPAAHRG
ncbi:hypothetical protein [Mycolicibacterium phlei]